MDFKPNSQLAIPENFYFLEYSRNIIIPKNYKIFNTSPPGALA